MLSTVMGVSETDDQALALQAFECPLHRNVLGIADDAITVFVWLDIDVGGNGVRGGSAFALAARDERHAHCTQPRPRLMCEADLLTKKRPALGGARAFSGLKQF
jgi:hypothetical protein